MHLDQAVFTSTASMTGQGYRLVAASPGLSADERRVISATSPSHGALCDPGEAASGLAFYALPTGRLCVARSRHAGQEQTGRGGWRVLTHVIVLTPRQFEDFRCDPFALLEAAPPMPEVDFSARREKTLSPLSPAAPSSGLRSGPISAAFAQLGESAMMFLIAEALGESRTILVDLRHPETVVRGVLLAIPSTLRARCSFSLGIKFALARNYRFNVIGPDHAAAKRLIRGQPIELVEQLGPAAVPSFGRSTWLDMVADCRAGSRLDQLTQLTARHFDDPRPEALDRVASLRITLNHLHEFTIDKLFDIVCATRTDDPSSVESELTAELDAAAASRLVDLLEHGPVEGLHAAWDRLASIAPRHPMVADFCTRTQDRLAVLGPEIPAAKSASSPSPIMQSVC